MAGHASAVCRTKRPRYSVSGKTPKRRGLTSWGAAQPATFNNAGAGSLGETPEAGAKEITPATIKGERHERNQ